MISFTEKADGKGRIIMGMKNYLFGVGPTYVSRNVASAFMSPLYGCQHNSTKKTVLHIGEKINKLLDDERCSFVIPGTGSTGMEACVVNLFQKSDKVLVCNGGVFATRFLNMCKIHNVDVYELDNERGYGCNCKNLESLLRKEKFSWVCIMHIETATGVMDKLDQVSQIVHKYGARLLVDAVASFGGVELFTSTTKIDVLYSASQKCLSAPVGLALISCSKDTMLSLKENGSVKSWCWDFVNIYEHVQRGVYPFTTAISLIEALERALDNIINFGMKQYFSLQYECSEIIKKALLDNGFRVYANNEYEAPMVKTYIAPKNLDVIDMREWLVSNCNIIVAGGIGDLKSSSIRVGTMGRSACLRDAEYFCSVVTQYMKG